ncbi:MAG: hypothetical protein ABI999_07585 [Acidobacteriota bacterium]
MMAWSGGPNSGRSPAGGIGREGWAVGKLLFGPLSGPSLVEAAFGPFFRKSEHANPSKSGGRNDLRSAVDGGNCLSELRIRRVLEYLENHDCRTWKTTSFRESYVIYRKSRHIWKVGITLRGGAVP